MKEVEEDEINFIGSSTNYKDNKTTNKNEISEPTITTITTMITSMTSQVGCRKPEQFFFSNKGAGD